MWGILCHVAPTRFCWLHQSTTSARHITFFSAALGIFKNFYIYVPPDLRAGQRAPVLYFLRGHQRAKLSPNPGLQPCAAGEVKIRNAATFTNRAAVLHLTHDV